MKHRVYRLFKQIRVSNYFANSSTGEKLYLGGLSAKVSGEVDADVRAVDELVSVPLKIVARVRQQPTCKTHRITDAHCLIPRTICYDRRVRKPH